MKTIFVSFDEEGWLCLNKILELGGNVAAVFTLKDELREKMSGNKPFDDLADKYQIPLYKIRNINDRETLKIIGQIRPDMAFVIGWSQLVKGDFLAFCKHNCIGIHPTMLPKHRGRAPLPWAIIFGLRKTGVTMFYIGEEADNGDIIGQIAIDIAEDDDAGSLYKKVLNAHVKLIEEYFPLLEKGEAPRIKQDGRRASYWPKRTPRDGIIDWHARARNLYDWIRALSDPYPGAFTFLNDKKLLIWKSQVVNETEMRDVSGKILEIDEQGLIVSTGEGLLRLTCVEFENGKRLEREEILNSHFFYKGVLLG